MVNLFKSCLDVSYIHTSGGGDYAVTTSDDTIYIFFEWSDGKEDWISNFDFPITPYKRMKEKWYCHRGFLKVWKGMQDDIELKVSRILANNHIKRIICVGYSHGGALSALATEDLSYLYGDMLDVIGYGFGAPRVLWGNVPKAVKERLKHFTVIRNIDDIVTHLPPLVMGYKNSGTITKIGKRLKYNTIKAHYPDVYLKELKEYMEGR